MDFIEEDEPLSRKKDDSTEERPRLYSIKQDEPIHDQDNLLDIKLTNSSKVGEGIMNAHTEYKVEVKTKMANYKAPEFTTVRRFKDFLWLRDQLLEHNKGHLIPPLPEKQLINRFNSEFVEYRRRELEKFLQRIVNHPVLLKSKDLQLFLEAENSDVLVSEKKQKKDTTSNTENTSTGNKAAATGRAVLSFLGSAVQNTVESVQHLNIGIGNVNEPDEWFDAKKGYIQALEEHLNTISKGVSSLVRRQRDLESSYMELQMSSSLLSSSEADHSQWISTSFSKLSEIMSQQQPLNQTLVTYQTVFFEDSIKDYIRMVGAVKEMLQFRNEKLVAYQSATKNLESKKEKFEKNKSNTKLSKEIDECEKKVEETKEEFKRVSELCKSEIMRFESIKAVDFKQMLVKLTQAHINYHLQSVDQWKKFLSHELSAEPTVNNRENRQ